jgi:hypothetical protein
VKIEVEGKIDTTKLNASIVAEKGNILKVNIKGGVVELTNNKLIILAE